MLNIDLRSVRGFFFNVKLNYKVDSISGEERFPSRADTIRAVEKDDTTGTQESLMLSREGPQAV